MSILDVASLKAGAEKDESSGQNRAKMKHGIFKTSTLMVPKQQAILSYPNKSSSHVENKSVCETSKPQHGNPVGYDQLQDNTANSSCEAGMSSISDGTRRKGDVEFEMQLAMALTATADNQHSSKVNEKNKSREITKRSDFSLVSDQVMSTAIGSKKVDSPLCWAEVYCSGENMDGKWVHVDAVNGMIDAEQNVEAAAAACKTFLRYVVAFAGGGAKDVTRRFSIACFTIALLDNPHLHFLDFFCLHTVSISRYLSLHLVSFDTFLIQILYKVAHDFIQTGEFTVVGYGISTVKRIRVSRSWRFRSKQTRCSEKFQWPKFCCQQSFLE